MGVLEQLLESCSVPKAKARPPPQKQTKTKKNNKKNKKKQASKQASLPEIEHRPNCPFFFLFSHLPGSLLFFLSFFVSLVPHLPVAFSWPGRSSRWPRRLLPCLRSMVSTSVSLAANGAHPAGPATCCRLLLLLPIVVVLSPSFGLCRFL
jgi:hypothetical protein